jgi:hypothetical protein
MAQSKGNGSGVAEFATGTLVAKSNLKAIKVDLGFDISGEDDASGEAVETALQFVQPLMYMGVSADAASDIIGAQTEVDYDGVGSNGTFVGGDGVDAYQVGQVITVTGATEVTVDAVDGVSGLVTEFTVGAAGGANSNEGATLSQVGAVVGGTNQDAAGFTITLGGDNVSGGGGVFHCIVDGSQCDVAALQAQIRAVGTVAGNNFAGATVALGTSITVA